MYTMSSSTLTRIILLIYMLDWINVKASSLVDYNNQTRASICPPPETSKCSCSNAFSDVELECPPDAPNLVVKVQPLTYVQIECMTTDENVYTILPTMDVGTIPMVQFRRCPLPIGSSIQSILDRLGLRNIRTLTIQSYGSDLGSKMVRQHLSGFAELGRLVLSGIGLSDLPEDLFDDVGNVTWLDLRSNKVHLPLKIFNNLRKLEILELGFNNLQTIEPGLFTNQERLRHLNLWGNNLQNLTRDAFIGVSSVEALDISRNNMNTLDPDVFSLLTNLTNLNLGGNQFKSLPEGLFKYNKKLMRIRLLNNRVSLDSLPTGFLSELPELEEFRIRCDLKRITNDTFSRSENLKNLSLADNQLETLPKNLFIDQKHLYTLDLSSNRLTELDDDIFRSNTELTVLKLSNNRLEKISGYLLQSLRNLQELYLDDNQLHVIHKVAFSRTENLQILTLQNNHLTFDNLDQEPNDMNTGSPFYYLSNLQELNVRNNSIKTILMDWVINGLALRQLDLSYNNITEISDDNLNFISDDIHVNLTNNGIQEIRFDSIELLDYAIDDIKKSNTKKVRIYVDNNPLKCDCLIWKFVQYIKKSIAKNMQSQLIIETNNLKCSSPPTLQNKHVKGLDPMSLVCLLDSPNTSIKRCPQPCLCLVRPEDRCLLVNCSHKRLIKVPDLPIPHNYSLNYIELYVENNNLTYLPTVEKNKFDGYSSVKKILANHNNIKVINVNNLPEHLEALELKHNHIDEMNSTVLEKLQSTKFTHIALGHNPWKCDCTTRNLLSFMQLNYQKISDLGNISCPNNGVLRDMGNSDICPEDNTYIIAASITVSLVALIFGSLVALYYKYQQEIKVWLYAHKLCLWFVTEEELDRDKKYDAFISYSHLDEQFVAEQLVTQLENSENAFKLCLHIRDWVAGELIPNQIISSVDDSRRTIVVLSPNFLESVWARMEFQAAHKKALSEGRARVIVIIYGDIENIDNLDPELKAYLTMNTYVKWDDPWFWKKLLYAMPHPAGVKTKGLIKNTLKSSVDDKLELIKPIPVTPPLTTPPADSIAHSPLGMMKLHVETNQNGHIKAQNGLNGHINGAFIINSNAKQSDV